MNLSRYLQYHKQALSWAIEQCFERRKSNFLMVLTLSACLTLPMLSMTCADIASNFKMAMAENKAIAVYIDLAASDANIHTLQRQLRNDKHINHIQWVHADKGIDLLSQALGIASKVLRDQKIALPNLLLLTPQEHSDEKYIEKLVEDLAKRPEVFDVNYDWEWAHHLVDLSKGLHKLTFVISLALSLLIILCLYHLLSHCFLQQQDYLELLLLLGANHAYIKRPMYYYACIIMMASSIIAMYWTLSILHWLQGDIIHLYQLLSHRLDEPTISLHLAIVTLLVVIIVAMICVPMALKHSLKKTQILQKLFQ